MRQIGQFFCFLFAVLQFYKERIYSLTLNHSVIVRLFNVYIGQMITQAETFREDPIFYPHKDTVKPEGVHSSEPIVVVEV